MPAKPLHHSKPTPRQLKNVTGYGAVGLRRMGMDPVPVQEQIHTLLEIRKPNGLPVHENSVIEVPRRAGKTEGLLSEAFGRCAEIDDYAVTYCAQSGTKSRERFYGLLRRVSRYDDEGGWKQRESRGEERFEFSNGSVFRFLPPIAASFRGDAQDWLIFDEAQEVDPEDAADLLGSVMPVFDTREGAQLTVAGTAGAVREGLLWESLEKGRSGSWGILEYALSLEADTEAFLKDPKQWLKVHPGPAGVSASRALEVLKRRRDEMSDEMFLREYAGYWPDVTSHTAFSEVIWAAAGREFSARPSRFAIAFDVTPSGDRASVVAVWRDEAGHTYAEVIEDKAGTGWVAPLVLDLWTRYKCPVAHDTAGTETLLVADEIARLSRSRVPLQGLSSIDFAVACAAFNQEVLNGTFRHFRQASLTDAVQNASRRKVRDGGWAWGRVLSSGSIAPLIAATVALKAFEDMPAPRDLRVLTAVR